MTVNLGAALRDWFNERDIRRWERRGALPPTLDRTYWTAYEYQRDLGRLQRRRYHVTNQQAVWPYQDLTPMVTSAGPRMIRARSNRQAVRYRISYERIAYSTWASSVPASRG